MEAFQLCPWDSPAFPTLFFEPTRVICRIFPQSHFPVFYLSATLSAPSSVEISLRFTRFFNGKFPAVAFRPLVNSPRRFHPGCPVRTFGKFLLLWTFLFRPPALPTGFRPTAYFRPRVLVRFCLLRIFCLFSPAMSVLYTACSGLSIGFLKKIEFFSTKFPAPLFPGLSGLFSAFFGQNEK